MSYSFKANALTDATLDVAMAATPVDAIVSIPDDLVPTPASIPASGTDAQVTEVKATEGHENPTPVDSSTMTGTPFIGTETLGKYDWDKKEPQLEEPGGEHTKWDGTPEFEKNEENKNDGTWGAEKDGKTEENKNDGAWVASKNDGTWGAENDGEKNEKNENEGTWGADNDEGDKNIGDDGNASEEEEANENVYQKRMPYMGGKDGLCHETVPAAYCHFALNGKHFGQEQDRNLVYSDNASSPIWTINFHYTEKDIRSQIVIIGAIQRSMDVRHNPTQAKIHRVSIAIDPSQVTDLEIKAPGDFTLPESFGEVTGFQPENIALITIEVSRTLLCNSDPPELGNHHAHNRLRKMAAAFRKCNKSDTSMTIEILVHCEDFSILKNMSNKFDSDMNHDPTLDWIKDSPVAHALKQNNLHSAKTRPALSDPSIILSLRRIYADRVSFLRDHIYCGYLERLYVLGLIGETMGHEFQAAFIALPGSAFPRNANDNRLWNLYRMTVKWPKELDRPRKGDKFAVRLGFEVPPCQTYVAPPPPAEPDKEDPKLSDDESGDEKVDIAHAREEFRVIFPQAVNASVDQNVAPDDEDIEWEENRRRAQADEQNCTWSGEYFGADTLDIPGEITIVIRRPFNQHWEGPRDAKPTVETDIPTAETRFKTFKRFADHVSTQTPRFPVKIKPIDHDQGWKDQLRCLNDFGEMDIVRNYPNNSHAEYLRDFTLSGFTTVEDNPVKFLDKIDRNKAKKIFSDLTPYQARQFQDAFTAIPNGIALVEGCPAAGKTRIVINLVTAWLARNDAGINDDGRLQHPVLWVTDTNEAVNQASSRIAESLTNMDDKKQFIVIRLYNMDTETDLFINTHVANHISHMPFFQNVDAETAFIDGLLNEFGGRYKDLIKDSRRTDRVHEFTLHQAANKYMMDFPDLPTVQHLSTLFSSQRKNPSAVTIKDIERAVKDLFYAVLQTAHVVLATCSNALNKKCSDWFHPTLIVKDEDPKSQPQYTYGLIAAYPKLQLLVLAGDLKQDRMYWQTNQNKDFINPFISTGLYSSFERFKDFGIRVCGLYEQHRMWNPLFVAMISRHFYNTAMFNANLTKQEPYEVVFMKQFHEKKFGIPSNVIGIDLTAGRTIPEEGGTSLCNAAHAEWAVKYITELLEAIKATKLAIDKNKFTVAVFY